MKPGGKPLSAKEIEARAKAAGLTLTDAQIAEITNGYAHIAAMVARVRGVDDRPREAEPDLVFRARFED